jgi:hypothetical protein
MYIEKGLILNLAQHYHYKARSIRVNNTKTMKQNTSVSDYRYLIPNNKEQFITSAA